MKLYYSPGACSLAPHIALREAGLSYTLDRVDLRAKKTEEGGDYLLINPKGSVPALGYDEGQFLTEAAVVLQYIADQKPESGLAPAFGTMERYRLMEWLNFIATEVHKGFAPFWKPDTPEATREQAQQLLARRFELVATALGSKPYLLGSTYTVADVYLYTIMRWTAIHPVDLRPWPILPDYMARVAARPAVKHVLAEEGLEA